VQASKTVSFPHALGFRTGATSVHTSRTMMLKELALVLENTSPDSSTVAYYVAIVEHNSLGKRTQTTRQRTAKRLTDLYALHPSCPVFRLLRYFWPTDPASQPMLALLAATARDPLLRDTMPFILSIPVGLTVLPSLIVAYLHERFPGRFQASTTLATAQRLASTWGQAGYLRGKVKKQRVKPHVTPIVTAFALVLGYLCGLRNQRLLDCPWISFLDRSLSEVMDLTSEASKQGWLTYKAAGAVVEITFPGLLTPNEERASYEPH
jgi:hypothetical protein